MLEIEKPLKDVVVGALPFKVLYPFSDRNRKNL